MRHRYESEDMPSGICEDCGHFCIAVVRDFGIGPYEYWGARGNHHDYQQVSPCCEVSIVEGDTKVIRTATHTARRDHRDGKIKAGEKYHITVTKHWRKGGPWWITTTKRKVA